MIGRWTGALLGAAAVVVLIGFGGAALAAMSAHVGPTATGSHAVTASVISPSGCLRSAAVVAAPGTVGMPMEIDAAVQVTGFAAVCHQPALHYAYYGLPAGCVPANTPQILCAPALPGTYHVILVVVGPWGQLIGQGNVIVGV